MCRPLVKCRGKAFDFLSPRETVSGRVHKIFDVCVKALFPDAVELFEIVLNMTSFKGCASILIKFKRRFPKDS